MIGVIGVVIVLGIVGPVAKERATKDDRLIVSNISRVSDGINTYVRNNKQLPDNLSKINVDRETKILIDKNLVEYKKETSSSPSDPYSSGNNSVELQYSLDQSQSTRMTYKYQLCVNYKAKSNENDRYGSSRDSDEYTYSPNAYSHPAGNVCYKLQTSGY